MLLAFTLFRTDRFHSRPVAVNFCSVDDLISKHASKSFNPSIANVNYLVGLIESWGGIEKICPVCLEDGSPLPEYTIHPDDIMIKFTAAEGWVVYGPSKRGTVKGTVKGTL